MNSDIQNRLFAWKMAIDTAHGYMICWEALGRQATQVSPAQWIEGEYGEYQVDVFLTSQRAVTEAAINMYFHIFGAGNKGTGVAANRSSEMDDIREELRQFVSDKMNWSMEEFIEFASSMKLMRDSFIAHYDGDTANFHQVNDQVKGMKLVGSSFNHDEVKTIAKVIGFIRDYVTAKLRDSDNSSHPS